MHARILRLKFAWFLALFLSLPATAYQSLGEKDLAKVLHYYDGPRPLRVTFTQIKKLHSLNLSLTSSGILQVQKHPQKIIWEILKPAPTQVILTQNEMSIISDPGTASEHRQVLKLDALSADDPADGSKNLSALKAWLDLDATAIARDYEIEKISTSLYAFTPKVAGKNPFEKLTMTLHPPGPIEKLNIHETSQDEIEIRFGKP